MAELSDIMIVSKSDLRDLMRTEFLAAVEERAAAMLEQRKNETTLITTQEVMALTGYSRRHIGVKISEGVLRVVGRENRTLLFNKQEVLDAIRVGKLRKAG